jgi:hypothetical protein
VQPGVIEVELDKVMAHNHSSAVSRAAYLREKNVASGGSMLRTSPSFGPRKT